eukprot:scaffold1938_cov399-Prasinococcus_capsulatus_cf.AAC.9
MRELTLTALPAGAETAVAYIGTLRASTARERARVPGSDQTRCAYARRGPSSHGEGPDAHAGTGALARSGGLRIAAGRYGACVP